jgi:hypothetical protein
MTKHDIGGPRHKGRPADTTNDSDPSRCTCETFGYCLACADRRTRAWRYRRTRIELAVVAEDISTKKDAARVAVSGQVARLRVEDLG